MSVIDQTLLWNQSWLTIMIIIHSGNFPATSFPQRAFASNPHTAKLLPYWIGQHTGASQTGKIKHILQYF